MLTTDKVLRDMAGVMDVRADAYDGNLALLSRTGSRAYGTDNENSDHDFRGVYVAENERVFSMGGVKDSIDVQEPHDAVVYELAHFCRLAAKANPTALELLWSQTFVATPEGEFLRRHRHLFLSKRITKTYGGYAMSQIEKAKRGVGGSRGADHHKRTKFKLHTLRLLLAGTLALKTREVVVRLSPADADNIKEIAEQDISVVEEVAQRSLALMDRAAETSSLPDAPNDWAINELIYYIRTGAI